MSKSFIASTLIFLSLTVSGFAKSYLNVGSVYYADSSEAGFSTQLGWSVSDSLDTEIDISYLSIISVDFIPVFTNIRITTDKAKKAYAYIGGGIGFVFWRYGRYGEQEFASQFLAGSVLKFSDNSGLKLGYKYMYVSEYDVAENIAELGLTFSF